MIKVERRLQEGMVLTRIKQGKAMEKQMQSLRYREECGLDVLSKILDQ